MATALPRYQPMGVQFADLPRVSTASQEVGAQMMQVQAQQFDQIGRAVDRMTAFFQEKAVTEAQKAGLRYAVENPLTKEQIDTALGARSVKDGKFSYIKLPRGIQMREPYAGEEDYFKKNPTVAGMATEDGKVILNPYSNLKPSEYQSVAINESARVLIKKDASLKPSFELTPEQEKFLSSNTYRNASEEDKKATIAARILSGDPSAGTPTEEQQRYVEILKERLKAVSPRGLQVQGAGRIFQESYEQAQGKILSSELQAEAQREISVLAAQIKGGAQIDPQRVQAQLKDMIDGYASTVMALDPQEAVRLRASLATAGSALYKEAAERSMLVERERYDGRLNQLINDSGALIETTLAKAGTIDPQTQKEVDVNQLLENLRKPFYDSIRVTGSSKHIDAFNKKIEEAKVGSLTAMATAPAFADNASAAMGKVAKGDFGPMTKIYQSMTNAEKTKVIGNVKTFFANMEEARRIDEAKRKEAERVEGNTLGIEFLNPKTTSQRKQEIVKRLVMIDQMTMPQAQDALKPKAVEPNSQLETELYQQIKYGRITTLGQLSPYASRLAKSQYESLGRSITDIQYRNAVEKLTLQAGITPNMFNPGQDKINQKAGYIQEFQRLVAGVPNKDGVVIQLEPAEAATQAITNYENNEQKIKRDKKRETAAKNLRDLLGPRMPTGLNIEQIDVGTIQNINNDTRTRAREFIEEYKKNITPKPTNQ